MKFCLLFVVLLFSLLFISCANQEVIGIPPETYVLQQNYPNPFTDTTRIIYGVPYVGEGNSAPWVRLVIYDRFLQRQVILVDDPTHPAKTDTVLWTGYGTNGAKVSPGLYYIELQQINGTLDDNESNVDVVRRITALKQ